MSSRIALSSLLALSCLAGSAFAQVAPPPPPAEEPEAAPAEPVEETAEEPVEEPAAEETADEPAEDEGQGPPSVEERPGGGCQYGSGSSSYSWGAIAVLMLAAGLLVSRRRA